MRTEVLAEIHRRIAHQRQRITTGGLRVCKQETPAPSDRVEAEKWYHEKAYRVSTADEEAASPNTFRYLCPVCRLEFVVTARKIEPAGASHGSK